MELNLNTSILFTREHPMYTAFKGTWLRSMQAYGGGAPYIRRALVRHMSEVEPEYEERLRRAYYTNYPRRVAALITQYVLSVRPSREGADPAICEDFTRSGLRVDEVMRQFCTLLTIYGCAWLAVDMPRFDGEKTKEAELVERLRPYCIAISPLDVVDWCYGGDGQLEWVLMKEKRLDNSNPLIQAAVVDVRRLWTRDRVRVYTYNEQTGERTESEMFHGLGVVPFIRHEEVDGFGIGENHWFEDVVRISDAILNYASEAQMNIVKQMFGLLVIPEDFLDTVNQRKSDEEEANNTGSGNATKEPLSHVLARSAALFESAEGKGTSRYISPSGTETAIIRSEMEAMRKELFSVVGLAASKDTKMVESAEAKAWDYQNVEHYMATRADVLEQCELRAWWLLNKWNPTINIPKVIYNRNFSILDLKESVATLLELSGFNQMDDDYQREVGKTALALLNRLRQLPQESVDRILANIRESTPGSDAKEQMEMTREFQRDIGGV